MTPVVRYGNWPHYALLSSPDAIVLQVICTITVHNRQIRLLQIGDSLPGPGSMFGSRRNAVVPECQTAIRRRTHIGTRHFPPGGVPLPHVARSSCRWRPPSPPTIPATCRECLVQLRAPVHHIARFAKGKTHYRSPVPESRPDTPLGPELVFPGADAAAWSPCLWLRPEAPVPAHSKVGISAWSPSPWAPGEAVVFTVYTGCALSGIGFTIIWLSALAWLSYTLHLLTMSRMGVSGRTLSRWRRRAQFGYPARWTGPESA